MDIIISERIKILQVCVGGRCGNTGEAGGSTEDDLAMETEDDTAVGIETEVGSEDVVFRGKSDVLGTR